MKNLLKVSGAMFMGLLAVAAIAAPAQARHSKYFSVKAGSHYVKGRCYFVNRLAIPDDGGCIINNYKVKRNGKRSSTRKRAAVKMRTFYYLETAQYDRGKVCHNDKRCAIRTGIPTGFLGLGPIKGMRTCIKTKHASGGTTSFWVNARGSIMPRMTNAQQRYCNSPY
ncbi:hypothetical protein IQ266_20245 [filamentous cyanobacterium LEGE 11480]|uniref:Uncharacterized protein n=1 Tax=Romeriopsis navalis LEGE 11480 TaxID=2777977 RepID=A0A928Z601_9CYAN|nr:hypothetical protein [Romeriopsis navalis]MBE9032073.1 hypothetical protein [Romeriopsis navalis LEGE 11480]